MIIKTPDFWRKKTALSFLLLPLSLLYFVLFRLKKFFSSPVKVSKPIICIGNLTAGGAGKTPIALALGKILHESNVNFAFLSRGYGGAAEFIEVDRANADPHIVGDEPILLSECAKTFVAKKRHDAALKLANDFDLLVMDDGMQNNSLYKDLTIAVVDGNIGFGNGFLLPAGPMREPISAIISADFVVIVDGKNRNQISHSLKEKYPGLAAKILIAAIKINNLDQLKFQLSSDSKQGILPFCAIGYPEKFFDLLVKYNFCLLDKISYPDHYFYEVKDLEFLLQLAAKHNAMLVTTKKDWVKFPTKFQHLIFYLDIELVIENDNLLRKKISQLK